MRGSSKMNKYLLSYFYENCDTTGVGQAVISVSENIYTEKNLNEIRLELCEKYGFDDVTILNIIPLDA